ncbi:ribonuclease III [Candidatus Gottesmanbacteria bacterium RIFOXYB1_FULL_47_11]|uniref:Ribonuclease 3 n=1 Tax=Candidatus Gottesmanbacteria bacterium RIFOXYB1_FULL_47_11 TaxID=1798401 RepID=A0A1F6BE47_9BACT|nr:MAG: ribonuclease III [Candidatus Gottesmanbacteria bacterium RIFOXYB1_FULL_47_11]
MTFEELQTTIGVTFRSQELLKQAFVHRSYLNEAKDIRTSNERLEFLGDAILSFLTSEYLYQTYPDSPEGMLTNIRSSLVKTTSLSTIAQSLHLGDLLFLSHGEEASGGRTNQSLLADVFEALLGALYLDQGIEVCREYLTKHLFSRTKDIVENKAYVDYKSLLQELIQQSSRLSPTYVVVKSEGPDHARTFWVEARSNATVLGAGQGKSKQEAEQQAALQALEKMGKI